jgi:hypothetical protein
MLRASAVAEAIVRHDPNRTEFNDNSTGQSVASFLPPNIYGFDLFLQTRF